MYVNYLYSKSLNLDKDIFDNVIEYFNNTDLQISNNFILLTNLMFNPLTNKKYSMLFKSLLKFLNVKDICKIIFGRYGCCTFDYFCSYILENKHKYDNFIIFLFDPVFEETKNFFKENNMLGKSYPLDKNRKNVNIKKSFGIFYFSKNKSDLKLIDANYITEKCNGYAPNKHNYGYKYLFENKFKMYLKEIDFIKGHFTGTRLGDYIEFKYLNMLNKPITALKGLVGHNLVNANGHELFVLNNFLNKQLIPKIYNLNECDFDIKNLILESKKINKSSVTFIQFAKSMIGGCSYSVFKKELYI